MLDRGQPGGVNLLKIDQKWRRHGKVKKSIAAHYSES
jgi:hypothetical protein